MRTPIERAGRDGAKPHGSVAVTGEVLLIIAPSGELLFSRDLGNKGMSGVAILDTDNDGTNDILTFGSHLDIYTLLLADASAAPSLN